MTSTCGISEGWSVWASLSCHEIGGDADDSAQWNKQIPKGEMIKFWTEVEGLVTSCELQRLPNTSR